MSEANDAEAIEWMRFVKVNVTDGPYCSMHGYLTEIGAKMLLIELRRHGLSVVKVVRRERQPIVFDDR